MSDKVLESTGLSPARSMSPRGSKNKNIRCCFAPITMCDKDPDLWEAKLRECSKCGSAGMHHHVCATDEKTRYVAEDPKGPGTSLCVFCAGLLKKDRDEEEQLEADRGTNVSDENGASNRFGATPEGASCTGGG
eukprot:6205731-Pleurochrysis_carterae.AAC.1